MKYLETLSYLVNKNKHIKYKVNAYPFSDADTRSGGLSFKDPWAKQTTGEVCPTSRHRGISWKHFLNEKIWNYSIDELNS